MPPRRRPETRTHKAGLEFPVGRIHRYMRQARVAGRIGSGAPVYLAAVLEYLCAEVLELSGCVAKDAKRKTIKPKHIAIGVARDLDLSKVVGLQSVIPGVGVSLKAKHLK
jgi:histone H2A